MKIEIVRRCFPSKNGVIDLSGLFNEHPIWYIRMTRGGMTAVCNCMKNKLEDGKLVPAIGHEKCCGYPIALF